MQACTPEIDFLEALLATVRQLRGGRSHDLAVLAVKEEQSLLRRLSRAREKAPPAESPDSHEAAQQLAEVGHGS
jgi:hypothetical protein